MLSPSESTTESLVAEALVEYGSQKELTVAKDRLRAEMLQAAADLEFEKAAELRDRVLLLDKQELALSG